MKTKDRLIAKMVAILTFGVTTTSLITGCVLGVNEDLLKKDIQNMENQKIECNDDRYIKELDEKINKATAERQKYQDILFPLVGTYLGAGTAFLASNIYLEAKANKDKKHEEGLTK